MNRRIAADAPITLDVHLEDADPEAELEAIRAGLTGEPKTLPPRLFYDDEGSRLFEEITTVPEYYQTRTERGILESRADAIVAASGCTDLVELGSGAATKTRVLLDAMARAGRLQRYVPFDVNEWIVDRTAHELVERYEGLRVHGVVGDFHRHLNEVPQEGPHMIAFLGGTIGNFEPDRAREFLRTVARVLRPGDTFLLGTDLIKDPAVIEAAYNDSRGVTARFNRNILRNVNRIAGADFDVDAFAHEAIYVPDTHRIEMWLRPRTAQTVDLRLLGLTVDFAAGEGIRTEISTKFDRPLVEELLAAADLRLVEWFADADDRFALSLATPRA